ncbi:MAG: DUF134 domain-containing protein [Synergistaceae bacterium]
MSRSTKCRKVCSEPTCLRFVPESDNREFLDITVEELESIRLCDLESKDQDSAADSMNVSRGTFQRILYSARAKIAEALCCGKGIYINGGNYETVHHGCHGEAGCKLCRFHKNKNNEEM